MSYDNTKYSGQSILNDSFDDTYKVLATEPMEYDPSGTIKRKVTGDLATKIVVSGTDIYVGKAPIGSATSAAVWQVKYIDTASGIVVKWADSNSNFDNVFDNYSSLTYG